MEKNDYGKAHGALKLIPGLRQTVDKDYPGTKIALSEYAWGDMSTLVGALAEADVLGIFGREQLDLACFSGTAKSTEPGANAFRLYRNYDGNGGRFGDISVQAGSTDQTKLAIYGAERTADHTLTLVILNKTTTDLKSTVTLKGSHVTERTSYSVSSADAVFDQHARVYRYSAPNLKEIVRRPDVTVTSKAFTAEYPARSATVVVVPFTWRGGTLVR